VGDLRQGGGLGHETSPAPAAGTAGCPGDRVVAVPRRRDPGTDRDRRPPRNTCARNGLVTRWTSPGGQGALRRRRARSPAGRAGDKAGDVAAARDPGVAVGRRGGRDTALAGSEAAMNLTEGLPAWVLRGAVLGAGVLGAILLLAHGVAAAGLIGLFALYAALV